MENLRTLQVNRGIPRQTLWTVIVMAMLTVANLHYNVPLLESIRVSMGASPLEANIVTVLTQGGYAFGLLFIVALGDLFDARKVILGNFCVLVAALLLMALGRHMVWLWVASVLTGLSSVAVQMYIPMVSKYSHPHDKARHVGYVVSGIIVGVLLGRTLGGLIGAWVGWRWLYGGAALLMVLCAWVAKGLLPPMDVGFRGTYGGLLRSIVGIVKEWPEVWAGAIRSAFAFAAINVMWACMAFHLAGEPFRRGSETVGLLCLCGLLTSMAVANMGKYVDRWGVRRFNRAGFLLMALAWCVLGLWGNGYGGLIAGIVLLDVGHQSVGVANQSHVLSLSPQASNRINTVYMTIYFLGGTLGTLLAGLGWKYLGWQGIVITGLGLVLMGVAAGWMTRRK